MTRRIVMTFGVPRRLVRIARFAGVRIMSQRGLEPADFERYADVEARVWGEAQLAARRALVSIRDDPAMRVPAGCRLLGLEARFGREALAQWVCQDTLFRLNFSNTCHVAFPDGVVVADFPPPVRRALAAEGFAFNAPLSRIAWAFRRSGLVCRGLAAHAAHFLMRLRDEFRPAVLGLAPDDPVAIWSGVYDVELSPGEGSINISDYVAARPDLFPPGGRIVCEGNPSARHAAPTIVAGRLFPLRRSARSGRGGLLADLLTQVRLAWATATGGWGEAMLGSESAKLPRARACLADLRPEAIYCTIGLMQYLSFWFAPARQAGAPVRVFCTSTQVFAVENRPGALAGVVPDIYMLPSAEEYFVWDDAHATDMAATGIEPSSIRAIGPVLFSTAMPRRAEPSDETVTIDYYDQVPASPARLLRIGAAAVNESPERLVAALEDLVAAAETAFAGRDWKIRMKSKRLPNAEEDGPYGRLIPELADACGRLEFADPSTSPLTLHADCTVTIGFPFVSPVVSAAETGAPAAFYDPDGTAWYPGADRPIPVLSGRDSLAAWLSKQAGVEPELKAGRA
jgi:hypothetical protein